MGGCLVWAELRCSALLLEDVLCVTARVRAGWRHQTAASVAGGLCEG